MKCQQTFTCVCPLKEGNTRHNSVSPTVEAISISLVTHVFLREYNNALNLCCHPDGTPKRATHSAVEPDSKVLMSTGANMCVYGLEDYVRVS